MNHINYAFHPQNFDKSKKFNPDGVIKVRNLESITKNPFKHTNWGNEKMLNFLLLPNSPGGIVTPKKFNPKIDNHKTDNPENVRKFVSIDPKIIIPKGHMNTQIINSKR